MDWKSKPIRKLSDPKHSSVQTTKAATVFNVLYLFPEINPAVFEKVKIMPTQQNYKWPVLNGADIEMIPWIRTLNEMKP